ncbi:hypothetical protein Hanom_Chr00s000006g01614011 [Helianthus anomalus]
MEEYTIPPVDATQSYRKRTASTIENEEDPCGHTDMLDFSFDMLDFSFDMQETSQLNLVMGVGTQTPKMMDCCNTHVQLSPSLIYSSEQQQQRQASNINKRACPSILISLIFAYKTLMIFSVDYCTKTITESVETNDDQYQKIQCTCSNCSRNEKIGFRCKNKVFLGSGNNESV